MAKRPVLRNRQSCPTRADGQQDGFRIIVRKDGLSAAPGNDLTYRFTLIVESLARLCSRSCIIDGRLVRRQGPSIIYFGVVAAPPKSPLSGLADIV